MSCMCDKGEGYVCFFCEDYLKSVVKDLIHEHKNEILDSCDWWWSIETARDTYDLNVHCYDDNYEEDGRLSPDAVFSINLYRLDLGDTSSYTTNVRFDLEPMTRKEIRLL